VLAPSAPPALPTGWHAGPPDFVGVGVQRGGTTRWFDLIVSHPEVTQPTDAKELHYFDRYYTGGCTSADLRQYQEYFPRNGNSKVGEWTPMYMSAPWVPELLAAAAPDTRLLVLLRDPIERYVSGLEHSARIARERGAPLSQHAPLEAFERGFYSAQLTRLTQSFDRSQILILQYERCVTEPHNELRRTFEFLGLRALDFAADVHARPNATNSTKATLDDRIRRCLIRSYTSDVVSLTSSFPEVDLTLWPNFAELAR
jgi:hypothetical protein